MNTTVKSLGKTYRVQKVARDENAKTFLVTTMPSGAHVVTMNKDTFSAAKSAAAKALIKHKMPVEINQHD